MKKACSYLQTLEYYDSQVWQHFRSNNCGLPSKTRASFEKVEFNTRDKFLILSDFHCEYLNVFST